jgi:hypothetical protein
MHRRTFAMSTKNRSKSTDTKRKTESAPRGGMPGDGAGRIEDPGTRGHGVRPLSTGWTGNPEARIEPMGAFGQGERGLAGYEDSGQSEVFTMPPGDQGSERQAKAGGRGKGQAAFGESGSNAGEVDPGVSGESEFVEESGR